jgi:hypothetical protein
VIGLCKRHKSSAFPCIWTWSLCRSLVKNTVPCQHIVDNYTIAGLLCKTSSSRQETLDEVWCNSWSFKTTVCNAHRIRLWFIARNIPLHQPMFLSALKQHFVLGHIFHLFTDTVSFICSQVESFSLCDGHHHSILLLLLLLL